VPESAAASVRTGPAGGGTGRPRSPLRGALRAELLHGPGPFTALLIGVLVAVVVGADDQPWQDSWADTMGLLREDGTLLALPLALALGCWTGGREHRRGTAELLASQARTPMARALVAAAPAALWPTAGFLLGAGACLVQTVRYADVNGSGEPLLLPLLAANAVAFGAAGVFGFAVGRVLRWRLATPLLAVSGLAALVAVNPESQSTPASWLNPSFAHSYEWDRPVWWFPLVLIVWYAAFGAAPLVAAAARRRLTALVPPAAALAAAALLVSTDHGLWERDARAAALVCKQADGEGRTRICLTRAHAELLPQTARLLSPVAAKLAPVHAAPHRFAETTRAGSSVEVGPEHRASGVVLPNLRVRFDVPYAEHGRLRLRAEYKELAVRGAVRPVCRRETRRMRRENIADGVAHWLYPHMRDRLADPPGAESRRVTKRLRTMPQKRRTDWLEGYFSAARDCRLDEVTAP